MATKVRRKGRTTTSRVSSKNQVTIPVDIMDAAGLEPGDVVRFVVGQEGVMLARVRAPLASWIGAFPGLSAAVDLKKLRDEWDS